jgi:hypothetical protein
MPETICSAFLLFLLTSRSAAFDLSCADLQPVTDLSTTRQLSRYETALIVAECFGSFGALPKVQRLECSPRTPEIEVREGHVVILNAANDMTRSQESIKRRAEKRGRTLEEQLTIEAKTTFKTPKANVEAVGNKENKESSRKERDVRLKGPVVVAKRESKAEIMTSMKSGAKKRDALQGGWTCSACNNENFAARLECNRCCRPKASSAKRGVQRTALTPALAPSPSPVSAKKCSNDGGVSWGEQASEEKIKENEVLRLLYSLIEEGNTDEEVKEQWQALSEDEKRRAKVLVERSQRKSEKKRTMRKRR